jgi:hypothetical protein
MTSSDRSDIIAAFARIEAVTATCYSQHGRETWRVSPGPSSVCSGSQNSQWL